MPDRRRPDAVSRRLRRVAFGSVIRVWNVGDAHARAQVVHPSSNSWTYAAFSPDGTRLVTGQLLCDARTGAFIANLNCNGPAGWLEGGPPPGCHRLANGVFAELLPFGLTLWDSNDGARIAHDRERRGRAGDQIAFDPMGTYHAIWSERGQLQLYRLRHGTLVHEITQPVVERWGKRRIGFSPDGTLLAWETERGERFAMRIEPPYTVHAITEEPWEREPDEVATHDGLLVAGDAAIPCDEAKLLATPHGIASIDSHYRLRQ